MPTNQCELPSVAIILFCYNQENFIEESLNSCLNQDYGNLTIIISDDCSTDHTFDKIDKIIYRYTGPHKIKLNKNKKNLGIGKHFAHIMDNLVDDELAVICAGDDISTPNRVSRVVDEWLENKKPSLIAHNLIEINELNEEIEDFRTIQYSLQDNSIHTNSTYSLHEYLKYHQPIPFLGAAVSYKVSSYKKFKTPQTYPDFEDHLMYFRALLDDGAYYFNEKLIRYRRHNNSYTLIEEKQFKDKPNHILAVYFNKDNKIKQKYMNCYTSHKVAVQQWIDYTLSINKHGTQVDFQIVENLWKNIIHRHCYLIQNKNMLEIIKSKLARKTLNKNSKKISPSYIKPLKTVVFGTSYSAQMVISKTVKGFDIIAACNTNNPLIIGDSFFGVEIIDLAGLAKIAPEIDCILIASTKFYLIKDLLLKNTTIAANKIVRVPQLLLVAR